ncbi:MAG: hypothetical protein GDA48_25285 [Hormoscilla sp. GM102CHS1]|nr:hypothetical protein [Hormoscilla sp. GM102CHS1]
MVKLINGVIHAACLPGGGLIQQKTREIAEKVMAPIEVEVRKKIIEEVAPKVGEFFFRRRRKQRRVKCSRGKN